MACWDIVESVPGVEYALAALAPSCVLCLASNAGDSDGPLVRKALHRVGLAGYFAYLWTSKELGASKPDPSFFRGICERLELQPAAVTMVGNDYDKDMVPAKAVGMVTVWFNPARWPAPGNAADVSVADMRGLPNAIRSARTVQVQHAPRLAGGLDAGARPDA